MGRGDKKTKKGKRAMGSYGVTRKQKKNPSTITKKSTVKKSSTKKKAATKKKDSKKIEK